MCVFYRLHNSQLDQITHHGETLASVPLRPIVIIIIDKITIKSTD